MFGGRDDAVSLFVSVCDFTRFKFPLFSQDIFYVLFFDIL